MKGLLIKDYKLLSVQKLYIILIFAAGLFFLLFQESPAFGINYTLAVLTIYTLSTISYDEFDNGMPFLMTLPSGKKLYALEKYVLIFFNIVITSIFLIVLGSIWKIYLGKAEVVSDIIDMTVSVSLIWLIFSSFLLPVYLKFGPEKSRIVTILIAGGIMAIATLIKISSELMSELDTDSFLYHISSLSSAQILIIIFLVAVIACAVSIKISTGIVEKREY